jgi:GT2 family glycosyltransferase
VARTRVLVAVTVYNGRDFVPSCLASAARMQSDLADIDLLVLDDASPDPGFSEEIEVLCADLGIRYYRTPRNLGIPRNVNLGLLAAREGDYDHVVIANSDVLFDRRLIDGMLRTLERDPTIGSVTSWSNNVSMFSLPNEDPDRFLHDQRVVDFVGEALAEHFEGAPLDIPAGISFSFMVPVRVLREVGLMDPIFGRGYCEETDWSLRSLALGYRIVLGLSCFTYHRGGGTNVAAGLVSAGHTTVPEHEEIIDLRYPEFRTQVADFVAEGHLEEARAEAIHALALAGAQRFGYRVALGEVSEHQLEDGPVVLLETGPLGLKARVFFLGFTYELPPGEAGTFERIVAHFGASPRVVDVLDPFTTLLDPQHLGGLGELARSGVAGYPADV